MRAQHEPSWEGAPQHHCLLTHGKHKQLCCVLLTQHHQQPRSLKELGFKQGAFFQPFPMVLLRCHPLQQRLTGFLHLPSAGIARVTSSLTNSSQLCLTLPSYAKFCLQRKYLFLHGFTIFIQRTQTSDPRGLGNKQHKKNPKDKVKAHYVALRTGSLLLLLNNKETSNLFLVRGQYLLASKSCQI